jgi:hypothetical protein
VEVVEGYALDKCGSWKWAERGGRAIMESPAETGQRSVLLNIFGLWERYVRCCSMCAHRLRARACTCTLANVLETRVSFSYACVFSRFMNKKKLKSRKFIANKVYCCEAREREW